MNSFRKAIPHNENLKSFEVSQIWMTKDGGWEWFVYRTEPVGNDVRLYALVFSPQLPNGEFGSVWLSEVKEFLSLTLQESLPPNGYRWEEKVNA